MASILRDGTTAARLPKVYHQLKPHRFDSTSYDVECPACGRGTVRLSYIQGAWSFDLRCSEGCGQDIERSWREFYLGERIPDEMDHLGPVAHATDLLGRMTVVLGERIMSGGDEETRRLFIAQARMLKVLVTRQQRLGAHLKGRRPRL